MSGRFITFEGIDGAGKSTQIAAVAESLRAQGHTLVLTREPGGTPLGERLRELILNQPMSSPTETLLVFAARCEHLAQVIRPALARGEWVLCDRFTDATYAYQSGGRGLPAQAIARLEDWVHPDLRPDLTVLFDIEPSVAAQRLAAARAADKFETETTAFFARVRAAYLARAEAEPGRFLVVNSGRAPDAVGRDLLAGLASRMAPWS
ncbi:MAG TPA: dTMP kinase [Burkholderiaceae bacterium]|jgi:dTMP kinase|nr:dTMP kinase [Burkholderiaceae bacterium]HRZ01031.1 dTMP kinase [Burkholderiaceae bacterium]